MVELAINRVGYIAMILAGFVVAFLELTIEGNQAAAYSVILLTAMITGGIYILLEYRFYRRHSHQGHTHPHNRSLIVRQISDSFQAYLFLLDITLPVSYVLTLICCNQSTDMK